ncbi:MAG: hypothetical protein ACRDP7_22775, partial [Trebonia sp.]
MVMKAAYVGAVATIAAAIIGALVVFLPDLFKHDQANIAIETVSFREISSGEMVVVNGIAQGVSEGQFIFVVLTLDPTLGVETPEEPWVVGGPGAV